MKDSKKTKKKKRASFSYDYLKAYVEEQNEVKRKKTTSSLVQYWKNYAENYSRKYRYTFDKMFEI